MKKTLKNQEVLGNLANDHEKYMALILISFSHSFPT